MLVKYSRWVLLMDDVLVVTDVVVMTYLVEPDEEFIDDGGEFGNKEEGCNEEVERICYVVDEMDN